MIPPFLVEGFDYSCPLQAYCTVLRPDFIIFDTIYPIPNISICIALIDSDIQFGDNQYTRRAVIKEFIKLRHIMHGVKHFYNEYSAVLTAYNEAEAQEYDLYNQHQFADSEKRSEYQRQMHKRLKDSYVRNLQQAIPEAPITEDSDYVIQPYLLTQILKQIQ